MYVCVPFSWCQWLGDKRQRCQDAVGYWGWPSPRYLEVEEICREGEFLQRGIYMYVHVHAPVHDKQASTHLPNIQSKTTQLNDT